MFSLASGFRSKDFVSVFAWLPDLKNWSCHMVPWLPELKFQLARFTGPLRPYLKMGIFFENGEFLKMVIFVFFTAIPCIAGDFCILRSSLRMTVKRRFIL